MSRSNIRSSCSCPPASEVAVNMPTIMATPLALTTPGFGTDEMAEVAGIIATVLRARAK